MTKPEKKLRRVRLELARDHDFPNGSPQHGYDLIVPMDAQGHLLADAWKALRDRCRVRRFWGSEREEIGHVVRKPGGAWAFHYDIHGDPDRDDTGIHLETHKFVSGEYVSLKEQDGTRRTFRVAAVLDLD